MAPKNKLFSPSANTDYIIRSLTDGTINKMSKGKIPKMSLEQAAGMVGSWIVETGRSGLERLDIVERGSARGRGLSQYTGARRTPYDQAVAVARAQGKDPNSAQFQMEYFAKEYQNKDLIGWTRVFEKAPTKGSPAQYAAYYTGSAAAGSGYFRPGTPHTDRRQAAAQEVFNHYRAQRMSPVNAQGDYNPNSVGKQGPTFDPAKGSIKPQISAPPPVKNSVGQGQGLAINSLPAI